MVCVAITEAANEATCATLPLGSVAVEAEANERGKLGPDRRWGREPVAKPLKAPPLTQGWTQ